MEGLVPQQTTVGPHQIFNAVRLVLALVYRHTHGTQLQKHATVTVLSVIILSVAFVVFF